jgi:hypothetical protein
MKYKSLYLCALLLAACGDQVDDRFKDEFYRRGPQTAAGISIAVPTTPTLPVTIGAGLVPDLGVTAPAESFTVPTLTPVIAPVEAPTAVVSAPTTPAVPPVVLAPVSLVPPQNPLSLGNTGSLGLEDTEPMLLAQYTPPFQQNPDFYQPKFMGINSTESVVIAVPKPPQEASPCVAATIIVAPIMAQEHQYDSWWLLASLTNTKTFVQFNQQQFYWATQISDQEVAVVPTGVAIGPDKLKNWKIDTGFAVLSYQLINVLQVLRKFPTNPDEPCVG